jgi:hypothetical protein
MSDRQPAPCPPLEELLLAADQLLEPDVVAAIDAHVQRCGACQRLIAQMEAIQRACLLDDPEADEEPGAAESHEWPVEIPAARRFVSPAALIPALVLAFLLAAMQSTPVEADRLVQRAEQWERANPAARAQRVSMRLAWSRPAEPFSRVHQTGLAGAPSGVPTALVRVLAGYRFDWEQPLSVARYMAWRAAHACCRRDRIVSRSQDGLLTLRTTAWDGELREAELTLRTETYQVVKQALVFEGVGRLEIEDLAYADPRREISPSPPPPMKRPHVPKEELDHAELKVRLLLSQTGLEMRRDVRVSRTPDAVRVEGLWGAAGQRRSARARLAAMAHVQVAPGFGQDEEEAPPPLEPGLAHWLDRTFSTDAIRASFLPELRRSVGTVRQRLELLAALAQRFPDAGRELSPPAQDVFQELLDLHDHKLQTELNDLKPRMAVLSDSQSLSCPWSQVPPDWPARATMALVQARTLEQRVQFLLAHEDLRAEERQRIRTTFGLLWETLYGRGLSD